VEGVGATIALPLIDAVNPRPPPGRRRGRIDGEAFLPSSGFPHGAIMDRWRRSRRRELRDSTILEPLKTVPRLT